MPRLRCRKRGTVEPEPGDRVDELAVAVDEVRDPERAIAQEDRHLASLAQTQQLALNRAGNPASRAYVHGSSFFRNVCCAFAQFARFPATLSPAAYSSSERWFVMLNTWNECSNERRSAS